MRPRGESISSPHDTYVGHAGKQNPQCTQSEISESYDRGPAFSGESNGRVSVTSGIESSFNQERIGTHGFEFGTQGLSIDTTMRYTQHRGSE
jgi:hypothetical protein